MILSAVATAKKSASKTNNSTQMLTPASIVDQFIGIAKVSVPKALGQASGLDTEAAERERGNEAFKKGDFDLAVKLYTKCLGLKVRERRCCDYLS